MSSLMFLAAGITSLGGLAFGYSNGIISGLLQNEAFRKDYGFTAENETSIGGTIASSLQCGGLLGVAFQSFLNDSLGRKTTLLLMYIFYAAGSCMQLLADSSLSFFILGRFVAGFSLSVITVSVSLYNTEIAASDSRGKIIGIQQLSVAFGMCLGYWLNFFIQSAKLEYELALGGQVVIAVIAFLLLFILPESPRWYLMKNQTDLAIRSLALMRTEDIDVQEEVYEISKAQDRMQSASWSEVFHKRNRKKLEICLLFVLFQQFAGQNLLFFYAPQLFKDLGLQENELLATGFLGIVKLLMTIPSLLVIDHLGRRPLMLIGTGIMLISFLYIGIYNTIEHSGNSALPFLLAGSHPFGISFLAWMAILCIYVFVAGYSLSWGVVRYVLPSETFEQSIRAKANSLCQLIDWLFQMIGIKTFPYLVDIFRGQVYFFFSSLLLCFLIWLWFLPETKGVLLEDMDSIFNPESPSQSIQPPQDEVNGQEIDEQVSLLSSIDSTF